MKSILLLFFVVWSSTLCAQETLTIKYFGLTIHPMGDKTAALQPNKLDKNAHFVINTGLFVGYEKFLYKDLISVKFIQAALTDCSNGFAIVTHFGVRAHLLKKGKHSVYFGIGPTLLIRDSWTRFGDAYNGSGYFNETYSQRLGALQWKFIAYAFEFEYDYSFNQTNQLSVSLTPGVPLATILSVGWKHWFHFKDYDHYRVYIPKKKKAKKEKKK